MNQRDEPTGRRPRQIPARARLLRAAAAAVLFLVACGEARVEAPGMGAQAPRADGDGSWRAIAASPLSPRLGPRAVWTGEEVIVWGGAVFADSPETLESTAAVDGAAYDPTADRWRSIADAPLDGGSGYSLVWTGEEMIVWGDGTGGTRGGRAEGAAYDPGADTWRTIAPAPLEARSGHLAVWTGTDMFVWGGFLTDFEREHYDGRGALYDPVADSWREVAPGPLPAGYDALGAWTGNEVVVMASPMGSEPDDYPKFASIAAYDPATDSWRELADPPMVTYVSPPAPFLDGELFLLSAGGEVDGGETDGYAKSYPTGGIYDTRTEAWRTHADPPAPGPEYWEPIAIDREIVLGNLAYDPAADRWRTLPRSPIPAREFPALAWTGEELFVWGGGLVPTQDEEGTVTHVDPPPALDDGAAYRPPG
ncbi:MAG: Kelch repeat-containing protein [Actinomycetota bacterium]